MTSAPALHPRKVALVCDASGPHTGLGRYWRMVREGLGRAGIEALPITPTLPSLPAASYHLLQLFGRDLRALLTNYPMWCSYPEADVYHLTTQTLGSLLLLRKPSGKVVVTVHDIFPYMLRNERWFRHMTNTDRVCHRLAMLGLKRADHLIAISAYTKRCLVELLGIATERITVIHHGIDHERFRPMPVPGWVREKYQLPEEGRYLLYVGSEDPRKKLETLVRALAQVRHELPDVELIKAGRSHFDNERYSLVELAQKLGVHAAIHFVEDVPEEHLPLLYSIADVYVTPSPYEGFGFPVLEAMACGIAVVYAAAGSLPEIAGPAGIAVPPGDATKLADALRALLTRKEQQSALRAAGRERAAQFTWTATTERILEVYRKVI